MTEEAENDTEVESSVPASNTIARRRGGRDPIKDLLIPVVAIALVVAAILAIQRMRDPDLAAVTFGDFSPIQLGSVGGGKPKLGQLAPGFQLLDASGEPIRLDDFRGRPVLLNFWATWCVPCRKETPELIDLQKDWGTDVQVVGVNYSELPEAVVKFQNEFATNYPLALDRTGEVTGSYKLTGLPESFFLDGEGVIRDHRIGQLRPAIAKCIMDGIRAGDHEPESCR